MNYDRIMIRYGEMSLKGRNRKHFVHKLKKNIQFMLRDFEKIQIESGWDRMYIVLNGDPVDPIIEQLKNVFGIQSFSPVIKTEKNIEEIRAAALHIANEVHSPGNTFKISARRTDKTFEYDTNGLNHAVGAHILIHLDDIKVDVKQPNLNIIVEIRQDAAYISGQIIHGAGGFPVASSGKAMLMLSGGIDSPVAGYLTMKRGVGIEAVHFHSPPFTSERAKQKVLDLARKLAQYSGSVKVHIVPFTKIQEIIHKEIPSGFSMTATRRMMLRITEEIRKKQGGLAIVTGESLGQVASQTMESMLAINAVTNTPIIRPLIAMDKLEIIQIAEEIDTIEISNRPYEDCCTIFTPPAPKTKPKLEKMEQFEEKVDWTPLLEEAVHDTETIMISARVQSSTADLDSLL
ncbi:tRNA uracil 4-sulfurtransferase ThiI [Lederbergia galactosidilytica]|uniref:Probable tRNA sulfurtransferase n=1 Tax=Lederbergia galactosidilytica TaxID=217031 RepID=A0A177ZK74_9BACI|nr:tRNA uracil 4-sulfurtransferase ThiI [Lederbergia galactosidilytica]KRG14553.1 thiamine biosynthesis protein ThiI [Virgibacillus soli]MBP1915370.1 thiamine biosynthesis protein ThiI [Lederbergia galactosidilytica]OAK68184.1 thiamine biosynthesis protein ThiI [Lederbergia galactosidilytica]